LRALPPLETIRAEIARRERARDEGAYQAKIAADRAECEDRLITFLERSWPNYDPSIFIPGWHLNAIAEHLEAVAFGQIRKLLINIPPRSCKTILSSVAWPAWIWAQEPDAAYPLIGPQSSFLCLTYGDQFAMDTATTMRRLVLSRWYQERWGGRVQLAPDTMGKAKFDTTAGGSRISTSVGGATLGRGAGIKLLDDVHKIDEVESEVTRQGVIRTYDEALKSRVTDPKTSAEVIIMQRLHSDDLSGHVLEEGGFVHLCLPAEFDDRRRCVTVLGWVDPREDDGDLLWPERFGRAELAPFKKNPYSWAGQFQQMPVPRGGGILKAEWWGDWEDEKHWPVFDYIVASLDGAYTEKRSNDPSALTIWGVYTDQNQRRRIMLVDAWREWLELHDLVTKIAKSCKTFKVDRLLIENKASGISVGQELERLFGREPWGIDLIDPKSQDKIARAHSVVPTFVDGVVVAPLSREWAQMVVQECADFPRGRHDDLVDSAVMSLKYLRDIGLAELGSEIQAARTDSLKYKSRSQTKALYAT
jgi:predicted phage terminase large subunit-like protein